MCFSFNVFRKKKNYFISIFINNKTYQSGIKLPLEILDIRLVARKIMVEKLLQSIHIRSWIELSIRRKFLYIRQCSSILSDFFFFEKNKIIRPKFHCILNFMHGCICTPYILMKILNKLLMMI